MDVRIVDLDGTVAQQYDLSPGCVVPMQRWGPRIRLACGFGRFRKFENGLATLLAARQQREPCLTLYGSGDFHHVSLAFIRRLGSPVNLLVIDNHPDWMRGIPFLHCG